MPLVILQIQISIMSNIQWFWYLGWSFTTLALLGNGLVIFLVISKWIPRTTTNWLIMSLAVADFCSVLSFLPPMFISNFHYEIDLSHAGLWYKICYTFMYSSTANLCVLTADRFIAVVKPLKYASLMKRRSPSLLICMAWLTSLIFFTLPSAFSYQGNESFTAIFEINRVFMFQVIPSIIFVLVTCILIYISNKLQRQTTALEAQVRYNYAFPKIDVIKNKRHPERRAAAMIILIITLFNATYAGGNYVCYCFITTTCVIPYTLYKAIHLMMIINAAANPIVYAFLKKDIRKALLRLFIYN